MKKVSYVCVGDITHSTHRTCGGLCEQRSIRTNKRTGALQVLNGFFFLLDWILNDMK